MGLRGQVAGLTVVLPRRAEKLSETDAELGEILTSEAGAVGAGGLWRLKMSAEDRVVRAEHARRKLEHNTNMELGIDRATGASDRMRQDLIWLGRMCPNWRRRRAHTENTRKLMPRCRQMLRDELEEDERNACMHGNLAGAAGEAIKQMVRWP